MPTEEITERMLIVPVPTPLYSQDVHDITLSAKAYDSLAVKKVGNSYPKIDVNWSKA